MTEPLNDKQVDRLIANYLAGSLSAAALPHFERWLRASPEHPRRVARLSMTDFCIREVCQDTKSDYLLDALQQIEASAEPATLVNLSEQQKPSRNKQPKAQASDTISIHDIVAAGRYLLSRSLTPKGAALLATAAALLLGVALTLALLSYPETSTPNVPAEIAESPTRGSDAPHRAIVATLTAERDAVWDRRPGEDLYAGQRFTLTEGFAEIMTMRGAIVILEAPATIQLLDTENAIQLEAGKLVGICETELSKGFVVRTPHVEITDLGTRFGVEVNLNEPTRVHVFEGQVSIASNRGSAAPYEPVVLSNGDSLGVDSAGLRISDQLIADRFTDVLSFYERVVLAGDVRWSGDAYSGIEETQWPRLPHAVLFQDLASVKLTQDAPVTLSRPGAYDQFDGPAQATIPRGTVVRSYVLVFSPVDPDWQGPAKQYKATGSVTFNGPILGVTTNAADEVGFIRAADQRTREPLSKIKHDWPESTGRDVTTADRLEITPDGKTLAFDLFTTSGSDIVRVFVAAPSQNPQP